jgi:hypothetical protein
MDFAFDTALNGSVQVVDSASVVGEDDPVRTMASRHPDGAVPDGGDAAPVAFGRTDQRPDGDEK